MDQETIQLESEDHQEPSVRRVCTRCLPVTPPGKTQPMRGQECSGPGSYGFPRLISACQVFPLSPPNACSGQHHRHSQGLSASVTYTNKYSPLGAPL